MPVVVRATYERVGTTVGLLFSLALAALLWWSGAYFTVRFLAGLGAEIAGIGGWLWLIPAGISGAELFLWPRRQAPLLQALVFLTVLAFDVGTTYSGVVDLAAGRTLALFRGLTIPDHGLWLDAVGLGLGVLQAFAPEKIARWVFADLAALWKEHVWKPST